MHVTLYNSLQLTTSSAAYIVNPAESFYFFVTLINVLPYIHNQLKVSVIKIQNIFYSVNHNTHANIHIK